MTRTPLILVTLAVATLLAGASLAQELVETELQLNQLEPEFGWSGQPLARTVEVTLCHGPGGANPLEGDLIVTITVDAVHRVITTHPENITITPPAEPSEESECLEPTTFELVLDGQDGLQPDETFDVEIHLSAEPERDNATGQPMTGNYETPEDAMTTFTVTTVPGPGGAPPPIDDGEPNDDEAPPDNDTPAPGALVVVLAAIVIAGWRRTRS